LSADQLSYLSIVYRFKAIRSKLDFLPETSQESLDKALSELAKAGVVVDKMLAQREGVANFAS